MKKWFSNFWYHHKFGTMVGAVVALIIGVAVWQLVTTPSYDYTVFLYLSRNVSTDRVRAMSNAISEHGVDIDENGEVTVSVINLSFSPYGASSEEQLASAATLAGELGTARHFIFITDELRFSELAERDIFAAHDFLPDNDNRAVILQNTPLWQSVGSAFLAEGLSAQNLPQLYMSIRPRPAETARTFETYTNELDLLNRLATAVESD